MYFAILRINSIQRLFFVLKFMLQTTETRIKTRQISKHIETHITQTRSHTASPPSHSINLSRSILRSSGDTRAEIQLSEDLSCVSGNQMVSVPTPTPTPATSIAALQHTGERVTWTVHSITGLYVFNSHMPQYTCTLCRTKIHWPEIF